MWNTLMKHDCSSDGPRSYLENGSKWIKAWLINIILRPLENEMKTKLELGTNWSSF